MNRWWVWPALAVAAIVIVTVVIPCMCFDRAANVPGGEVVEQGKTETFEAEGSNAAPVFPPLLVNESRVREKRKGLDYCKYVPEDDDPIRVCIQSGGDVLRVVHCTQTQSEKCKNLCLIPEDREDSAWGLWERQLVRLWEDVCGGLPPGWSSSRAVKDEPLELDFSGGSADEPKAVSREQPEALKSLRLPGENGARPPGGMYP